jgi:hypothetical protein
MMYRIVDVQSNGEFMYCSDVTIENTVTGEKVVCDGVKVWEEDQYSLAYMFKLVKYNKWSEGMLDDAEIAEIEAEGIVDESEG